MAIDGKVSGVQFSANGEARLILESRDGYTSPGQEILVVLDWPAGNTDLLYLIDKELWGNSSELMLGDEKIADRISYATIRLVENWRRIAVGQDIQRWIEK